MAAGLAVAGAGPVSAQAVDADPGAPPDLVYSQLPRGGDAMGLWSDGTTIWVATGRTTVDAFSRETGARDPSKDITVSGRVTALWSDGQTMWATNRRDFDRISAYAMDTGERQEANDLDISSLGFASESAGFIWRGPLGLTSDGETMWVASNAGGSGNRLYALDMTNKARKPELDIVLGEINHPRGLWTDGETMWVGHSALYTGARAYNIATKARVPSLDIEAGGGSWGAWSDGNYMWVSNFRFSTVTAYPMPDAYRRDATLSSLSVVADGDDLVIGMFSAGTFDYEVVTVSDTVTVAATAARPYATIEPAAAGNTDGHQESLDIGENVVTVTVTAPDRSTSQEYSVMITRNMRNMQSLQRNRALLRRLIPNTNENGGEEEVVDVGMSVGRGSAGGVTMWGYSRWTSQGSLSPDRVELGVESTTVQLIGLDSTRELLYLGLSERLSDDVTLVVDGVEFELAQAPPTLSAGWTHVWSAPGLDWSVGDEIEVEFVLSPSSAEPSTDAVSPPPLTASFVAVPSSHDGAGPFVLRVQFSEAITTSYVNVRDDVFTVTNAEVTRARRVDGRSDLWEITVDPSSGSDIVITLSADAACGTPEAVCARGPKQLSNNPAVTVDGTDELRRSVPRAGPEARRSTIDPLNPDKAQSTGATP